MSLEVSCFIRPFRCHVLGISRAGYYAAQHRDNQPKKPCAIRVLLKSEFEISDRTYGSRRLQRELNGQGISIGIHRIRHLMKEMQMKSIWKPKFVNTTDSRHNLPVFDNILNRKFNPPAPNQAWVSDITYIRVRDKCLYLAVVLDLYSRKVISWAMSPTMPAELGCHALKLAISHRQPKPGLLVHSDRGSQYASKQYQDLLNQHGFIGSMSRKGNCWDNSVMERFFLNLKMERVWRKNYANYEEAKLDVTDYMINFYNSRRLHSTLDYVPPNEYKMKRTENNLS